MAGNQLATLSQTVSAAANTTRRVALRVGRDDLDRRLIEAAGRWADTSCVVTLIGSPGVGKSTLAASLTGIELARPDDATGTTVVTVYRAGPGVTVRLGDRNGIREIDPADLPAMLHDERTTPRADLVEIRAPAPRLIDTVALVDTPPVNGVDEPAARHAMRSIDSTDAVIFLVDATRPISRPELAVLADAASRTRAVCVVVTKTDRFRGWRTIVDQTRAACRVTPSLADAPVFGMSARLAEAAFAADSDDDARELLDESGIAELQSFIADVARQVRRVRLRNFAALTTAAIDDLAEQLRARSQALGDDRFDEHLQSIDQARRAVGELRDDSASWLHALTDSVTRARDELTTDLLRQLGDCLRRNEELVGTWTRDGDELAARVDADLVAVADEFATRLRAQVDDIAAAVASRTEFERLHVAIDRPMLVQVAAERPAVAAPAAGDGVRLRATGSIVSAATSSSMLLTMAGGDASLADLVRIGALGAAAVFSGALAAFTIRSDRRRRDEAQIRAELRARIDAVRQEAPMRLRQHLLDVQRSLESQVRRQARERMSVLEAEVAALQAAHRTALTERRREAQRADDELRRLVEHRRELERIERELRPTGAATATGGASTTPS